MLLILVCALGAAASPVVLTPRGKVSGTVETSRGGRRFLAFRSVPYAKAPVGRRRLANPEAVPPWPGVLDASADAPYCLQYDLGQLATSAQPTPLGQEDCLYLSVFTHKTRPAAKYPVMVYLHGGGFFSWTGARMHGPEYFMDHDLVVVMVNYRLGPLGFLSTEDDVIPGNLGLKDQVLALKWVRENIGRFGGDAGRVTLAGESAGAAAVHLHLKSRQSRGLFRRGILSSGSAYSPWGLSRPGAALAAARRTALGVGCPVDNSTALLDCLRSAAPTDILSVLPTLAEWSSDPFVRYSAVVESSSRGFFSREDLRRAPDKDVLVGVTSAEGTIRVAAETPSEIQQLDQEFTKWAPITLGFGRKNDFPDISREIKELYFCSANITSGPDLTRLYSDALFYGPLVRGLEEHQGRTFLYSLDHRPALSFVHLLGLHYPPGVEGVSHADDLFLLFNMSRVIPNLTLSEPDLRVSRKLVGAWYNFISSGEPSSDGTWAPSDRARSYVRVQQGGRLVKEPTAFREAAAIWNGLLDKITTLKNTILKS